MTICPTANSHRGVHKCNKAARHSLLHSMKCGGGDFPIPPGFAQYCEQATCSEKRMNRSDFNPAQTGKALEECQIYQVRIHSHRCIRSLDGCSRVGNSQLFSSKIVYEAFIVFRSWLKVSEFVSKRKWRNALVLMDINF